MSMVVIGVLSALVDRARHGRGAYIDVALRDALTSWTTVQMTGAFAAKVANIGVPLTLKVTRPNGTIYRSGVVPAAAPGAHRARA